MKQVQNCCHLIWRKTLAIFLLLSLALVFVACVQPARGGRPVPTVTPTWGAFYPTVVPWVPSATGTLIPRLAMTPTIVPTQQPGAGVGASTPTGNKERFL